MARPIPKYLRLYSERTGPLSPDGDSFKGLAELCRAFEHVTGWPLRYVERPDNQSGVNRTLDDFELTWSAPVDPGVGAAPGHLKIETPPALPGDHGPRIELELAGEMASAIAGLLNELARTQHALWQREAELAVGVPLVPHREEEALLARRLESVLKAGAEAISCQAAGLYLLDTDTTHLKLRSCWNLPIERLTSAPRVLREAAPDLEALLGHAVVLDGAAGNDQWHAPEEFSAAVCLPVSTPTVPLGTLWLFSRQPRGFTDAEVNIAELVAGRLASDLEREMLLAEGIEASQCRRQLEAAERLQSNQLPRIAPLVDGWQVAGWTMQAGGLGGDFFDWFVRSDDSLALAVGDCLARGVEAALAACALRAALRAHGEHHADPGELIGRVNRTMWVGSAGDQAASLFLATVDPARGAVRYAAAGHAAALLLRPGGKAPPTPLPSAPSLALGLGPETHYATQRCRLAPGEALLVISEGVRTISNEQGRSIGDDELAGRLAAHLENPADTLVDIARGLIESHCPSPSRHDRTVLVLKRLR